MSEPTQAGPGKNGWPAHGHTLRSGPSTKFYCYCG